MEQRQDWYRSRGVWGGIAATAAGMLAGADYALTPAEAAQLPELLFGIGSGVGGILAIIGRIRATKRIAT